jgi:NAD(P)-dependent dehydrogenase (short-subunit alcohol dehydrogenase family)
MELAGKVIVLTGGAAGIGRALAVRFAREQPRAIYISDIDTEGVHEVARQTAAIAVAADSGREDDIRTLAERALDEFGRIDLFCSNAGVLVEGGAEVGDEDWDRLWAVNVKAHVWAARAVVPSMLARGEGYLLQTISAAGLLTAPGSAPYSVAKHAALGLAEWLAITYGDRGLKVSCLCPQFVLTNMLLQVQSPMKAWMMKGAIAPEAVADAALQGLREERFLILPHPEVAEYFRRKAGDYDRWLAGMRRLQARLAEL